MDEWVWCNGGMIVTGENWSTGRKTIYSVGGRWMNEYGAMVEWYWQGKTEVLGEKHYTAWGGRWMNEYGAMVEWYWQGKAEVLGEKSFLLPFNFPLALTTSCTCLLLGFQPRNNNLCDVVCEWTPGPIGMLGAIEPPFFTTVKKPKYPTDPNTPYYIHPLVLQKVNVKAFLYKPSHFLNVSLIWVSYVLVISALRTGRLYLPWDTPGFHSFRGWVDHKVLAQRELLSQ